jgi:hypothetical protein
LANTDFSYALTETEEPQIVLPKPGFVYAPVVEGQEAGYAYVCIGDKSVGKIPLVYGATVEQEITPKRSFWKRILGGG